MSASESHSPFGTSTIPLDSQIGGHPGVQTTEDGSLLIKPALPLEVQFYQSVLRDPELTSLLPFVPKFYGTLKLEGKLDESQSNENGLSLKPVDDDHIDEPKESLVLENVSHSFSKPNIIDIKLGTVLHYEGQSPEKQARMKQKARDRTSFETGLAITAFQVYDNVSEKPVSTPRDYCRSLKASDLPDVIRKFFPSESPPYLPRSSLLPILEGIREEIADIREALAEVDIRMVGASLLIVYEADWTRAEEGVKSFLSENHTRDQEDEEDEEEDGDDDDDEDSDSDSDSETPNPPYAVKLIDFAHTRVVPGAGSDEGVLLGLDNIIKLLDDKLKSLRSET